MTGMQALERIAPDKLPIPGHWAKHEFEYKRHGTITLIGFLDVVTGRIEFPFLNKTRTAKDFEKAMGDLIGTDPEKNWIFVCDGLNIHKSEEMVRMVAELCGITEDLGKKNVRGILKNKKSREKFLRDKSHRIRFIYTPRHCSWLNQIEIWFSILSRKLLKRMSYKSVEDLKESVIRFIDQYNITAHPFKWTCAGKPLVKE